MRARIIAMFLAVGMALSLGGCGGSKGTPAPEVEPTQEDEVSRFTADELEGFWSSGSLTKEEIETMVAAGEVSNEVYEEFLDRMSEDVEFNVPEDESFESPEGSESPVANIDTSSLLTAHVIEFEDADGYQIRETIQISPIFREDDLETAHALWEALGNDISTFPDEESLYRTSYLLKEARDTASCDKLEYIIGTYTIENLTDGFLITPDAPRTYDGLLAADGNETAATFFNFRSVTVAMYADGAVYYGEKHAAAISRAKMLSDTWGPICFIIALPNGSTPNRPDGYRYDECQLYSGGAYLCPNYTAFQLTYFE